MNPSHSMPDTGEPAVTIQRVAEGQWHAVADDRTVGRGHASHRPDGRIFVSADAWHPAVFDRLAEAMAADLPRPLHTVVDEADLDLTCQWERAGFAARRREWEYLLPTDPRETGLGSAPTPAGVTIVPFGEAEEGPLRTLDRVIRDEVEATVGWREMPAEVLPGPLDPIPLDPTRYAAAERSGAYVGLVRVAALTRQPRIGLIAVRSDARRQGIGRAMLAQVLGALHARGAGTASAEVNESNVAAMALVEGVGARRTGSNLELVLR
ncbi:MAG: GNAT family N-acetyltransferase [Nonomuraea sp.]|nr:GNAT family N-acetyltransferase [Nonomuraea sp.]